MTTINRKGVNIHYEVHGSGPPILLSHGYSATSAMWRGQVEALRNQYTVITWDMRGHGRSDYPADPSLYSEVATVADMLALLNVVGVDRAIVGGLSLGGYMSLAFHCTHPARVCALMIFDSGPGYKSDEARRRWNAQAEETARDFEKRGLDRLQSRSREMAESHHRSADGLIHAARGMLAQFDDRVIRSLPDIKVPVLVLVGEDDAPFLAPADYMAAKIPHATKTIIPNAGHAANLDNPAAFNAAVAAFLTTLTSAGRRVGSGGIREGEAAS
jgi:pimeloyl-ACP methyl ester carboxylesterase